MAELETICEASVDDANKYRYSLGSANTLESQDLRNDTLLNHVLGLGVLFGPMRGIFMMPEGIHKVRNVTGDSRYQHSPLLSPSNLQLRFRRSQWVS